MRSRSASRGCERGRRSERRRYQAVASDIFANVGGAAESALEDDAVSYRGTDVVSFGMTSPKADSRSRRRLWKRWWFLALLLIVPYYTANHAPLPFVASWWRHGQEEWNDRWHRRHRMVDWMLLTGSLIGLTKDEVVAKLGEPPPTDYFHEWSMVYMLGSERGFASIDSEWLVLRIDETGHVTDARIVHD